MMTVPEFYAWSDMFLLGMTVDKELTEKQVQRWQSRAHDVHLGQPTTAQEFLDRYWSPYLHATDIEPVFNPDGVFDPLKAFAELGRLDRATIN